MLTDFNSKMYHQYIIKIYYYEKPESIFLVLKKETI